MQKIMQVHFNFLCRQDRANKKGESPVILRIIYRRERRDLYTGLYCSPLAWDADQGMMYAKSKKCILFNQNLDLIRYKTIQLFDEMKFSGIPFTMEDLVQKIKGNEEKPILLTAFLESRKEELQQRVLIDITPTTYEKYERVMRFALDFVQVEYKLKSYPLVQIDVRFLEKFFLYLRSVRKIGNNTSVKYLGAFRTLLMPAMHEGIIRKNPFLELKFKSKKVYKGYLTNEELTCIIKADLKSVSLERVRDQFLFCCYTGLAYVDLGQLGKANIRKDNGGSYFIEKPRQKTGQLSIVPLIIPAIEILKKYSNSNDFRDFSWYVSTNQKINEQLKTIGRVSKVEKLLHFHLARHTFATTITLSNGVPIESVSSMLGHATIRQTQDYAKVVALKLTNDMKRVDLVYS
jgi:site-specific recombinase XerD